MSWPTTAARRGNTAASESNGEEAIRRAQGAAKPGDVAGCKPIAKRMNAMGPLHCRKQIKSIVARTNRNKKLMGFFERAKCGTLTSFRQLRTTVHLARLQWGS
jgi:hypothetical protein